MSFRGWQVLRRYDELESEADFWVRYQDHLHPDEARAIVYGEIGVIKRPVAPDWTSGEWMELASNFWMRPDEPKLTNRGWRIHFRVRDFRARMPRRVPQMHEPPELDDQGHPIPHDAEAIKKARLDGNYTSSAALAVAGVGDEPDDFTMKRIHREREHERMLEVGNLLATLEDLRAAVDERLSNNPDAVRIMGKDAWALRNKIDAVQRRLRRRAAA